MHLKKFLICLTMLALTYVGFANEFPNPLSMLKGKRQFIFGIDNRRTDIHQQHTVIYGLYTGISFGKNLRFKVGVNGTPFEVGRRMDQLGMVIRNRFFFLSLGEEFDFYQYKRFILTTYLQAGYGFNTFRSLGIGGVESSRKRESILPVEAGLHCSYELCSYLKLRVGGGWRYVIPEHAKDLGGYYIKLGLSFSLKKFKESRAKTP